MPDPRTSTALRQLADLGREPAPSRWSWAVRTYESGDRLRLPAAVVADAVVRAKRNRPTSAGRASQETCIAALRALFARATASGLTIGNPAAALAKPPAGPQPAPSAR